MPTETLLVVGALAIGFGAILYLLNQKLTALTKAQKDDETLRLMSDWMKQTLEQVHKTRREMHQKLDNTTQTVDKRLFESSKHINERLDNASKVIGAVNKELGEIGEIGRQMKDLQDFLRSPKLRGNIGEQILRDLLEQNIPRDNFALQHSFRGGTVVDATVKTDKGIIPIDAKFPLENFKLYMSAETERERKSARKAFARDVKKHINDIAKKYILPEEGTVDFALMYIPSEPVAYEITVKNPDLIDYAHKNRVVCVSPNQFNYFLKVILIGLEGRRIEEKAKFILDSLKAIEGDTNRFADEFRVLIKHVSNAKNMADSADSRFRQLQSRIESVRSVRSLGEPEQTSLDDSSEVL
jgi:DNA recombination protein RmuC